MDMFGFRFLRKIMNQPDICSPNPAMPLKIASGLRYTASNSLRASAAVELYILGMAAGAEAEPSGVRVGAGVNEALKIHCRI